MAHPRTREGPRNAIFFVKVVGCKINKIKEHKEVKYYIVLTSFQGSKIDCLSVKSLVKNKGEVHPSLYR
jgi:hypothetical protein